MKHRCKWNEDSISNDEDNDFFLIIKNYEERKFSLSGGSAESKS